MQKHLRILKFLYKNQDKDWANVTLAFNQRELKKHGNHISRAMSELQKKQYIETPAFIAVMEDESTWPDPNIRNARITYDGIVHYQSKTLNILSFRVTKFQLVIRLIGLIGFTVIVSTYKKIIEFLSLLF